jgi:CHAT domain-containing protein
MSSKVQLFIKFIPGAVLVFLALGCSAPEIGSSGLGNAIKVVAHESGYEKLSEDGLSQSDLEDLASGRLFEVRSRYESKPQEQLTSTQLRLLCDLLISFSHISKAAECLDSLEDRVVGTGGASENELSALAGRKALISIAAGQYAQAANQSANLSSNSGRYINALASARLGRESEARATAEHLSQGLSFPRRVFFSANIWVSLGRCDKALDLLINPRTRLAMDYGLSAYTAALGNRVEPATFRVDLFDEFRFGYFDAFSYAPRANQYVEFMTGYCLFREGHAEKGKARLLRVLNDPGTPAYRDVHWMTLHALALLAKEEGNSVQAEQYFKEALQIIEEIRSSIATDTGRIGFVSDKFIVYADLVDLYRTQQRNEEALETLERAKARALVDLLAEREDIPPARSDSDGAEALLKQLTAAEARLAIGRTEISESATREDRRQLDLARSELISTAPNLGTLVSVKPRAYADLIRSIPPGESILHFHRIGDRLYASLIEDSLVTIRTLNYREVASDVRALRHAIEAQSLPPVSQSRSSTNEMQGETGKPGDSRESYLEPAKRLYEQLIRPFDSRLVEARGLVIVPTSSLFYIPFSVLHDGNQHLIERLPMRVLPSLTTINLIESSPRPNDDLLIVANPNLGDGGLDLPGTEMEANRLAWLWPEVSLLIGDEATEANITRVAPSFGYLHIASHGEFNSQNPLDSRLRLRASDGYDGSLTAAELYSWRLQSRLVVLSACETAVSDVSPGDDLIGLMTGFLYAGTQGVVGSLWAVNDVLTAELTTKFYSQLQLNRPPSVALQKAQIQMMREYPHPYLWAALTYIGQE